MLGQVSASDSSQDDGTTFRSLRLPFELLELALRELEGYGKELLEPQCRMTMAAFSERLRVLGETSAAASAKPEACSGPFQDITQNASSCTPKEVVEDADAAGGGDQGSEKTTPIATSQQVEGKATVAIADSRVLIKKVTQYFEQLDSNSSGSVGALEMALSFRRMGLSQAQIRTVIGAADTSGNGLVDRKEFLAAARNPEILEILEQANWSAAAGNRCMLSQSSPFRVCWDLTTTATLSYMAIAEPFFLAFPSIANTEESKGIAMFIDVLFFSDVVLNFRTGFYTQDYFEVLEPCEVAKNYLKTWFILDLTSAVPLDLLFGDTFSNLQALRLLKYWKLVRVMKFIKLSKNLKGVMKSERFLDWLDWFRTTWIVNFIPLSSIFAMTMLVCHWLACFMIASGDGFLGDYQDVSGDIKAEYVSGVYWAFTTISTVGYGDITPGSTLERLYSIVAMSIGGSFYGYFIARFTSIITRSDFVKQVYTTKMTEVDIWLQHHQFPMRLQKRARRYFERHFKSQTHIDDISLLNSLSPELRREICKHIVLPEVRDLRIFAGVPAGVMSRLAKILKKLDADKSETLVRDGEVGSAVYIIVSGEVYIRDQDEPDTSKHTKLGSGDCFGEELLLNPTGLYEYSAVAHTNVSLQVLPVAAFLEEFGRYHDVFQQVRFNIESARRERGLRIVSLPKPFETEVIDLLEDIRASRAQVSLRPFETQVLDQLRVLQASQKECASKLWNEMRELVSRTTSQRAALSESRFGFEKL